MSNWKNQSGDKQALIPGGLGGGPGPVQQVVAPHKVKELLLHRTGRPIQAGEVDGRTAMGSSS